MLSNNQNKFINSLKIKKYRQVHNAFIVEGEKGVHELLESSLEVLKVYALYGWIEKNETLLLRGKVDCQEITQDELKKISDLVTPNQVLAVATIPTYDFSLGAFPAGMALALDGIRDPGNLGTMIRTADWFGINRIVCSTDSVDMFNPKVVQATMGSFCRVEVHYVDLEVFFQQLLDDIPVYGALLEGPSITQTTFVQEGIILIGSESHGISKNLIPFVSHPVHIPMFNQKEGGRSVESLNASIANGIICYEICKQLTSR